MHTTLAAIVGADRVKRDVSLAPLTTFRVGGTADWLIETRTAEEIVAVLAAMHRERVPVTVLGGGSNTLVGDRGVRGVVIRPRGGTIERTGVTEVRAEAAVTVNALVRWTINKGFGGLERWAGTPGTVGGGIFGNAHFDGRLLGERVTRVSVAGLNGDVRELKADQMEFGYDRSRLQRTREVLLWAEFHVTPADPTALRAEARHSLAHRKRTQPLESPSAGCIFQNPDSNQVPDGVPPSAGALVDRAGLKGRAIGRARVSPTHGNFIINDGGASAQEIRQLIELCRAEVLKQFGVELKDEIVYIGEF